MESRNDSLEVARMVKLFLLGALFGWLSCSSPEAVSPAVVPLADSFDFPVGPPDAAGYRDAQAFGENDHLGEDWNGLGGGDTDLGDPVYSAANGLVLFAEDIGGGWGNVVRVAHR